MSSLPSPRTDVIFPGDGEMARRMRAYPWAGRRWAIRGWSASLRTAVRICLTSRFPMIVWWGTDLRFLYNDAYLPLLGTKHPALAKPGETVWPEIWDVIGPMLGSVMSSGQATWSEDLLLPMNRHGYWEETYWTYSYSPLHDDAGVVRGVFTAVSDTTERVIGERRLAALQDLGAQPAAPERGRGLPAGGDRPGTGAGGCPVRRHLPAQARYQRSGPGRQQPGAGRPRSAAGRPGRLAGRGGAAHGQPVAVSDVAARFGDLPAGDWQTPPAQALVLPLVGEPAASRPALSSSRPAPGARWTRATTFLGLVAGHLAARVTRARPTRTSSAGPRSSPSSTAPRPRSSRTSATSSAPRSP